MKSPEPQWLALAFGLSEFALSWLRRSKQDKGVRDDRGSLRLIWRVILIGMLVAAVLWKYLPHAQFPMTGEVYVAGLVLFAAGLLLRWYSIFYLGKYFTVDVAVAADHKIIDTGPYRYIRHPSYSGVLLEFLGLSLCFGNAASMLVLMAAVVAVFLRRIAIEESVLQQSLGDSYTDYMRRTRRLIPFVY